MIVLGISEDDDRNLFISGVKNPEKTIAILWDNLNNPRFVNYNLLKNEDIRIEEYSGLKVIAINVPAADRRKRPIYIKNIISKNQPNR